MAKAAVPSSPVVTFSNAGASAALSPSAVAENSNVSPALGARPLTVFARLSWNSPVTTRVSFFLLVMLKEVAGLGSAMPIALALLSASWYCSWL